MARKTNPSKRDLILKSAIKVISQNSYEKTKVADIAREAGIAYGLVYHYFENKDEILRCIFQEKWDVFVKIMHDIDFNETQLRDKLMGIAGFLIHGYRVIPEVMRLMMLEISRRFQFLEEGNLERFMEVFEVIEDIFIRHQRDGEIRADIDPRIASFTFLGAVESILVGYALGTIENSDNEDEFDRLTTQVVDTFLDGVHSEEYRRTHPREGAA